MNSLWTQPFTSWTHRLTRLLVRPLVGTAITPNHLTTVRVVTGIAACIAFAVGDVRWDFWGGVLWIVSCLLDRADGELARLGGTSSPGGHLYDLYSDIAINSLFFLAIGIGLRGTLLDWWAIPAGVLAAGAVAGASVLSERLEKLWGTGQKAYVGIAGFDFDDVIYLFAPAAWLGWLSPLLIGAALGAPVFLVWTWMRLRIAERQAAALAQRPDRVGSDVSMRSSRRGPAA